MEKEKVIKWIKAASVRAIRTIAQSAIAMIPVGVTVAQVGWLEIIGTSALAGIVSILTSIAGLPEVK